MPYFERYIKEQLENASGVENVIYGGKKICEYDEYKKYYSLNEQLLGDLYKGKLLGPADFVPPFHVAQANQSVISHLIKASKITSDPSQEFWLKSYLSLHLYSDIYELVRKEYAHLGKNLPRTQDTETPFTTIRNNYSYCIPLFESCINEYKYVVSHAMYLITESKQIFIYPRDSKNAKEVKPDELVRHFNNVFLLYNALFVSKIRLENSYLDYLYRERAKTDSKFIEGNEKIFQNYYENPQVRSSEEFLNTYSRLLKENPLPPEKKNLQPKA